MSPEQWDRIQALFVELKDLEPGDRARRLGEISDSDPELHSELESLLSVHGQVDQLLDSFESLISQPSFESATVDDAADEETTPDPHGLIGRRISHYDVTELLGAGGMGVLYKADDIELGRTVALKFLPPQWSLDAAFNKRFRQEARAVAALDHPNVCAVYEVGETEAGQLFIAMTFYEGETVREKIVRGPLGVEEALELATQAASGLAAAHQAGVTHRDIKPANLIVTEGGVLKILDFGLAKTADATVTETGMRLGTPAYMSPEQTRGEEIDARTDLWSLGVVLYEMLTARRPFRADSSSGVIHAIRHEEPDPPDEARQDLPEELAGLVLSLLSKDPEARYAGAEALSEELAAAPPVRAGAGGRLRGVRPAWLSLGGVAAAVVLLVAVGMLVLRDRGPAASSASDLVAVLPWKVLGESSDLAALEEGLVALLSIELSGLPGIRTVDQNALAGFVEGACEDPADPECGEAAARRFGAGRFLVGTVVPIGDEDFQLAASIRDARGGELSRVTVRADGREPLQTVDELGRGIVAELLGPEGVAEDSVIDLPAMAARTAASLPALKAYLEGESYFRSFRYHDAVAALRKAVEADSNFALAWYRLALTANKTQRFRLADAAAEQAMERMADLPYLYQRLLQGFDYLLVGKADLAEREFRNLVATHPDSPEAWFLLGETLHDYNIVRGLPRGGYEAYARALELDPDLAPALWRYRSAALFDGRLSEFDSLNALYIDRFSMEQENVRLAIADSKLVPFLQAEDDSTRERWFAELEEASDDDVARIASQLANLSWPDRTEAAVRAARILADPARSRSARRRGYEQLARLAIREGRWRDANLELDALATVDPIAAVLLRAQFAASLPFLPLSQAELSEIRSDVASIAAGSPRYRTVRLPSGEAAPPSEAPAALLIRLAILSARLGEFDEARRYAAQLAAQPVPDGLGLGTIPDDVQLTLRAHILSYEGDPQAARAALDSTRYEARWHVAGRSGASWTIFLRGEVLFQLGELEEAKHWYSFWPTPGGSSTSRYLGPSLYRLGQIHDELGEPREARERYEQFVALWANADPELQPWVEDARARMTAETGGEG
jgi:tetratricopeptide (TPR) repeat protein